MVNLPEWQTLALHSAHFGKTSRAATSSGQRTSCICGFQAWQRGPTKGKWVPNSPVRPLCVQVRLDHYVLYLGVLVYSVSGEFVAHAGLSEAAEGHLGGVVFVLVDPDGAELQFP